MSYAAVIVTQGRRPAELRRAIAATQTQSVPPDRTFVVVTDPAAFADVRRDVAQPGINTISTPLPAKAGAGRMLGVEAADTEFVALLDDDDWWAVDKSQQQLDSVRATAAHISFTGALVHTVSRTRYWPHRPPRPNQTFSSYLFTRTTVRAGWAYLPTPSMLFRRDLALRVRWEADLPRHQDWDWLVRLEAQVPDLLWTFVDAPLTHVEMGADSVSRARKPELSLHWALVNASRLTPRQLGTVVAMTALRETLDEGGLARALHTMRLARDSGASFDGLSLLDMASRLLRLRSLRRATLRAVRQS